MELKDMNSYLEKLEASVEKAKTERDRASYLSECGSNAGLRKMNDNKQSWLTWVIYLAERGLETERERMAAENHASDAAPTIIGADATSIGAAKDTLIKDASVLNKQLQERLDSVTRSYQQELLYRKAIQERAKLDVLSELVDLAHDTAWLDGTTLVCPVEIIDNCLLKASEEPVNITCADN